MKTRHNKANIDRMFLEQALFSIADGYCTINLTKNYIPGVMHQVIEGEVFDLNAQIGLSEDAPFDESVKAWATTVPQEGKEEFINNFNRERLLECFNKGETNIAFNYITRTATYEEMLAEDHIAMFKDEVTGDVMALNYVIDRAKQDRLLRERLHLEEENNHLEALLNMEREYADLLSALSNVYDQIYDIDIDNETYEEILTDQLVDHYVGRRGGTDDEQKYKDIEMVDYEYRDIIKEFLDIRTLSSKLENTNNIAIEYRRNNGSWYRARFIVKHRDETGKATNVLHVISNIDYEKHIEDYYRKEMQEKSRVLSGLGLDYTIGFILNLDTDEYKIIFNQVTNNAKERQDINSFKTYVENYADQYVLEQYKSSFKYEISSIGIKNRFRDNDEYHFSFQTIPNAAGLSYFQAHIVKQYDHNGRYAILGFRSIDEAIKKEQLYKKDLMDKTIALESERKANQSKSDFLSRMSHDMRTPLNGILGLLKINQEHMDDLELIEENQEKMKVAANHLLSLINNVLQMSKIEGGDVELSNEEIDFRTLFKDVMTIIEEKANEEGVQLKFNIDKNFHYPIANGSPTHLRQIFLNIYTNCIKYTPLGGSVTTTVETKMIDEMHCEYKWIIEDTGIGMSEEFLKHVFDPFVQEKEDARTVYQGVGLGMSIVKGLVEQMDGTIEVESKENVGSIFTITIPFEIVQHVQLPIDETIVDVDITQMNLLLVEDNELNAEIARVLLEKRGAKVTLVTNGKAALDLFSSTDPYTFDVILMDIMMPIMDGLEATKAIRQVNREEAKTIPIIAMTANAFKEDAIKCFNAGMNAHLAKPLDIDKVVETICKLVKQ